MTNEDFLRSISLDGEEWRDVIGYEGLYSVSNIGRVASFEKKVRRCSGYYMQPPRLLKFRENNPKMRHCYVSLFRDRVEKRYYVHRLVAAAFLPNPQNMPIVEHLDCNPRNNHVSNLRWCDQTMNMNNPISKERIAKAEIGIPNMKRRKPIVQLKDGVIIRRFSGIVEAERLGFNQSAISMCCHGKISSHAGFEWLFESDYESSNQ